MHRAGVIHGDISPQNILVGYDGIVRVTDFGIAKTEDNMFQPETSALRGKVSYLAPEQLMGRPQEPASDLFSLGVVLWEAATAKRMFPTDLDPAAAVEHRLSTIDRLPRPDALRAELPEELTAIITKSLSSDPKLRYPDARTMGTALRAFQIEHCPSVCSDRWEAWMHELFADRLAVREQEPSRPDDELSELLAPTKTGAPPRSFYDAPPAVEPIRATARPLAEPIPVIEETEDVSAEPITGVWKIRKNRNWIPAAIGFVFTVAILMLAGIPVREKAPAPPPTPVKIAEAKKHAPAKPPARRKKRVKAKKPAPLLFGADDL